MKRFRGLIGCIGVWLATGMALTQARAQDDPLPLPAGPIRPAVPSPSSLRGVRIESRCLYVIDNDADTSLALRLRSGMPAILEVDFGNDGVAEFRMQRERFDRIVIDARGGDDEVLIDEANGIFTDTEITTIMGGAGDDTLRGGSGGETFDGGPGHDTALLGGGDDRFVWNPGAASDVVEGGAGLDTIEINGRDGDEAFTVTANGTRVRFDRLSPASFNLDIGTCENLVLNAKGGNDSLGCTGNLAALIRITADGGAGDDTLLGSNGADVLIGGDDDDFVDGQQGADTALLGAGDDRFQWDPGDGNDTIEGQAGHDTVLFNGSSIGETFDFSGNGARLRFTRNIGNVVLDADGVEQFDLNALGGADLINSGNLTATAVAEVNIDLAATSGGVAGDAQQDSVNIVGTPAADTFDISADAGFTVVHLAAEVRVKGYEAADQVVIVGGGGDNVNVFGSDGPDTMAIVLNGTQARIDATGFSAAVAVSGGLSLAIQGRGGADTISCAGNLAGLAIPLTLDGGAGDDTVLGSNGADVLIGGDDDDFVDGQQGADTALLGAGDDTFQWDPGDGNDTIEGEAGNDAVFFNGSNIGETFAFSANGTRLRFTRNIGNVVLDADGIEQFDLNAFGGADIINAGDLTATALAEVNIDLAAIGGVAGDAQPDAITVNGTEFADTVHVAAVADVVEISGMAVAVRIAHSEAALDGLTINGLGGIDTITADPGVAALILLSVNP
jgi:Ca2+-binding RTX toxin-like protein